MENIPKLPEAKVSSIVCCHTCKAFLFFSSAVYVFDYLMCSFLIWGLELREVLSLDGGYAASHQTLQP